MTPIRTFEARVQAHRDRLMSDFGIVKTYRVVQKFRLDALEREKVSVDPHDHVVRGEVDLSDNYALIFGADVEMIGLVPDGETASEETIHPETDDFRLAAEISSILRQDAIIRLGGLLYGGTSLELDWLDAGVILRIWGLARSDLPKEFYKETIAEALCLELDGRRKQSFFAYATALDSLVNFRLSDIAKFKELRQHVTHLELKDKLALTLKRALNADNIDKLPLVGALTRRFQTLMEKRNKIAHSIERVAVEVAEIGNAMFLLIVLMMVFDQRTVDVNALTQHYGLRARPE